MDFRVNESCCGVSLRTGTLIIGVIDAVTTLLEMVGYSEISPSGNPLFFGLVIFITICHTCKLVSCCLLLFGVFMDHSMFVIMWLIMHVVITVIDFFKSIGFIFLLISVSYHTGVIIFIVIVNIVELALAVYYYVVVRSYYDEMQ